MEHGLGLNQLTKKEKMAEQVSKTVHTIKIAYNLMDGI